MNARRLLIDRVANMRELGGYSTEDGGLTRWGRFIRSDAPLDATEEDIAFLREYGVRTVIDLRAYEEAAWKPCPLAEAAGLGYVNIPFTDDFTYLGSPLYCPLDHLVPVIKGQHRTHEILTHMSQADGAVLFFCYAGKDRTGMIAALLLLLAHVPVEDVIADYQVTYTYIRRKLVQQLNDAGRPELMNPTGAVKRERAEHLRRTEPEWIEPFITHVLSFGGIEAFLRHTGMAEADITRLQQRLTV